MDSQLCRGIPLACLQGGSTSLQESMEPLGQESQPGRQREPSKAELTNALSARSFPVIGSFLSHTEPEIWKIKSTMENADGTLTRDG